MINLLPPENIESIKNEYRIRLLVASFFVLGGVLLLVSGLFVPSLIALLDKKENAERRLSIAKQAIPLDEQNLRQTVAETNAHIDVLLNNPQTKSIPREYFFGLLASRGGVRITDFSFEETVSGKKMHVRGIAPTRTALTNYIAELEKNTLLYKSISAPVSNFVKNTNSEFSLEIIPN